MWYEDVSSYHLVDKRNHDDYRESGMLMINRKDIRWTICIHIVFLFYFCRGLRVRWLFETIFLIFLTIRKRNYCLLNYRMKLR